MVAVYARVSTDEQSNNTSIPLQVEEGNRFCKQHGYKAKNYIDAFTGASISREGWTQLFKDIETGIIDGVWVKATDRFSRNTKDGLTALEIIRKKKVKFYISQEEQDINTPEFEMLITMQFAFAQFERSKILKRTLEGRIATTNAGGRKKQMIYGYDSHYDQSGKRRLVINKEEAKVVRYIFDMYVNENLAFKAIAKRLNDEGYKTKNYGKKQKDRFTKKERVVYSIWSQTHISYIIKRPEYCGLTYNWDHSQLLEAKNFEKIIDKDMWLRIQPQIAVLAEKRNRDGIRISEHELSGVIRCVCSAQYYYRKSNANKSTYYFHKSDSEKHKSCKRLPKYIRAPELENAVRAVFMALYDDKKNLDRMFKDYKASLSSKTSEQLETKSRIKSRMEEIEKRIESLINAVEDGTIKKDRIKERMGQYEAELEKFQLEYERIIEQENEGAKGYEEAMETFRRQTYKDFISFPGSRKRDIYHSTFKSITVIDGCLVFELTIGGKIEADLDLVMGIKQGEYAIIKHTTDKNYKVEKVVGKEIRAYRANQLDNP